MVILKEKRTLIWPIFVLLLAGCATVPPAIDKDATTWGIDNINIHHFEKGNGEVILMIHGGPGFPFSEPIPGLDPLTKQYRFVYFDQRGCGKSTHPFTRFEEGKKGKHIWELISTLGYKQHIRDMEAIRQNLGQEKIILMGHSFGAVLASLYAQEYPDRVKAMILVSPAALLSSHSNVDMFKIMEEELPPSEAARFLLFKEAYFDFDGITEKTDYQLGQLAAQFGEFWVKALDIENPDKLMANLPTDMDLAGGYMHFAIFFSFGKQWDFTPGMKKITAPVLIFQGEKDLQPISAAELYHNIIASSQLVIIQKASHFPFTETPDEFNHQVSEFLAGVK